MENKTVIYKGKVYEIGAPYLFSERDKEWVYGILTDVDCNYKKPFCTDAQDWSSIKEIPSGNNGTITPAPAELINGNVYMFKYHASRKPVFGVYSSGTGKFITTQSDHAACACTDIRKMTVEEVV